MRECEGRHVRKSSRDQESITLAFKLKHQEQYSAFYGLLGWRDCANSEGPHHKHIREHLKYPPAKSELIAACAGLPDVPKVDREWFEKSIPDRTYYAADEVIGALNLYLPHLRLFPHSHGADVFASFLLPEQWLRLHSSRYLRK